MWSVQKHLIRVKAKTIFFYHCFLERLHRQHTEPIRSHAMKPNDISIIIGCHPCAYEDRYQSHKKLTHNDRCGQSFYWCRHTWLYCCQCKHLTAFWQSWKRYYELKPWLTSAHECNDEHSICHVNLFFHLYYFLIMILDSTDAHYRTCVLIAISCIIYPMTGAIFVMSR